MVLWIVFDIDDTLILNGERKGLPAVTVGAEKLTLFADTKRVLDYFTKKGVTMAIASFRTNVPTVLKAFNLQDYFASIQYTLERGVDVRSKSDMINEMAMELNLSPHDVVFFDDLPYNYEECSNRLIHTIPVDPTQGVTMELLLDALVDSRKLPLYVITERNLPREDLLSYLQEYRVTFLDCKACEDSVQQVLYSQPYSVILFVPEANTVEIHAGGTSARITYPSLWECINSAMESLREGGVDLPLLS